MEWVADVVDLANEKLGDHNAALGPSYFMRKGNDGNPNLTDVDVERIWKHSVFPYIEELRFGDPEVREEFALERLRNEAAQSHDRQRWGLAMPATNWRPRARARAMHQIDLQEGKRSGPHPLSADQRDALRRLGSLTVERADSSSPEAVYYLTPGSEVGAFEVAGCLCASNQDRRPTAPLPRLLCHGRVTFQQSAFDFLGATSMPDPLARALVFAARRPSGTDCYMAIKPERRPC